MATRPGLITNRDVYLNIKIDSALLSRLKKRTANNKTNPNGTRFKGDFFDPDEINDKPKMETMRDVKLNLDNFQRTNHSNDAFEITINRYPLPKNKLVTAK